MSFIKQKVLSSGYFLQLKKAAEAIYPPGFEKLNLWDILKFFFQGVINFDVTTQASSLAFKFFLAIFPGLIFMITLLPYIPIENFQRQLMQMFEAFMPGGAYDAFEETLSDLIKKQRGGLLSFGFFFALFLATDGIHAMITAFNNADESKETRNIIQIRFISLIILLTLFLLILVSISLIIFSGVLINYLKSQDIIHDSFIIWMLIAGKWIISIIFFLTAISFIFWIAPQSRRKFRFFSAGSSFTTVFSIIVSLGFAYYVDNFGTYNKLYGSIGTVMVIMLWIYFNAIGLLLGYRLNVLIREMKKLEKRK
jgi:membrane protein